MDFADEGAVECETVHAVVALPGPACPDPQVAVRVGADAVGRGGVHVVEGASIRDAVAVAVENADVGSIT